MLQDPSEFLGALTREGIDRFFGVPDSLLKGLLFFAGSELGPGFYVCANEGSAVAMASGSFLATGKPACVYMQNSGLGNAINPLLSLADPMVFAIPMLLLIGFRGEPSFADEPQHKKQGAVSKSLLEALAIPYFHLNKDSDMSSLLAGAFAELRKSSGPVAILVSKDVFPESKEPVDRGQVAETLPGRAEAIASIVRFFESRADLAERTFFVASTGKIGRELYELRQAKQTECRDFYCIGGMGHASQIALAIALSRPDKMLCVLDGDGAALMHLGNLAGIGALSPANFLHVILNNGCHESVGGQDTVNPSIDFAELAQALGYRIAVQTRSEDSILSCLKSIFETPCSDSEHELMLKGKGPALMEVKVAKGSRDDLPRPAQSPQELKEAFLKSLSKSGSLSRD